MFDFCINHKDVAILVNQYVTRDKVPYLIGTIRESSFLGILLKTKSCHVGIYHNLCGRMGIGNARLGDDWLNRAAVKASKTIEGIGCVREKKVVQQNLFEQGYYTAAVQKVVHLKNEFFGYIPPQTAILLFCISFSWGWS